MTVRCPVVHHREALDFGSIWGIEPIREISAQQIVLISGGEMRLGIFS